MTMADTAPLPTESLPGKPIEIEWDSDKESFLVGAGRDRVAVRVPDEFYVSTLGADPIARIQDDQTIIFAYLSAGFDSDEDDALITVTIGADGEVLELVSSGPLGDDADAAFDIFAGE